MARRAGLGDWGKKQAREAVEQELLLPLLSRQEAADVVAILDTVTEVAAEPGRTRVRSLAERLRGRLDRAG